MSRSKTLQMAVDEVEPTAVQMMVTSLKQLNDMGKPQTDEQVEQRIGEYFEFCQRSGMRPGVESLAVALHVSRITVYNWSHGEGCSSRRQEMIENAKGMIAAFLEQCMLSGKINPAAGIFTMKNWFNYKDLISFEEANPVRTEQKLLTAADLPKLGSMTSVKMGE